MAEASVVVVVCIIFLPLPLVSVPEYINFLEKHHQTHSRQPRLQNPVLAGSVAGGSSGLTPKPCNNSNVYHLKTAMDRRRHDPTAAIVPVNLGKRC